MAILTHYSLTLHSLRFPTPVRLKAWKGALTLLSKGAMFKVQEGNTFTVPSFIRFNCTSHPRARGPAVWSLEVDNKSIPLLEKAADNSKPWTRELAKAIFAQPQLDWRSLDIELRFGVHASLVRTRLFREGESLRSLIKEQRVASLLASVSSIAASKHEFSDVGFASQEIMEGACLELIGLPRAVIANSISMVSEVHNAIHDAREYATYLPQYRCYF